MSFAFPPTESVTLEDVDFLDWVQRRAKKLVRRMEYFSSEESLRERRFKLKEIDSN